eukprot:5290334-Prymnesium_polylepis.2
MGHLARAEQAQDGQAAAPEQDDRAREDEDQQERDVDDHHDRHEVRDRREAQDVRREAAVVAVVDRREERDAHRRVEDEDGRRLHAEGHRRHVAALEGLHHEQERQVGGGDEHARQHAEEELRVRDPLHEANDEHPLTDEEHLRHRDPNVSQGIDSSEMLLARTKQPWCECLRRASHQKQDWVYSRWRNVVAFTRRVWRPWSSASRDSTSSSRNNAGTPMGHTPTKT